MDEKPLRNEAGATRTTWAFGGRFRAQTISPIDMGFTSLSVIFLGKLLKLSKLSFPQAYNGGKKISWMGLL